MLACIQCEQVFKVQLCGERPVQHKERLVHTKFVDFMWLALGLDGVGYLYFSTSSKIALLPICSAKKHLVVQGRNRSLQRILN